MNRRTVLLGCVLATAVSFAGLGLAADAPAGTVKLLKTLDVDADKGWDYITVDAAGARVYLSHGPKVVVFDMEKGKVVGEIQGVTGSHGVALVPELNLGFATAGRDNDVVVFDLKSLKTVKTIKTGQKPDAVLYDPASKKVFAFCGKTADASVIDPAALDKDAVQLPLGGAPEAGVSDGAGKVYVNLEDKSEVVEIDTKEMKVLNHWTLGTGEGPTGLALDAEHHRLFSGCANKKVIVLDTATGKVIAEVAAGSGIDGVAFDPAIGAVSANGRDGTVSVVTEKDGTFAAETVPTIKGARTITVDPVSHHFLLPCLAPSGKFAVIVVGKE